MRWEGPTTRNLGVVLEGSFVSREKQKFPKYRLCVSGVFSKILSDVWGVSAKCARGLPASVSALHSRLDGQYGIEADTPSS